MGCIKKTILELSMISGGLAALLVPSIARADLDYFIDEARDFEGNCGGENVNTVTDSLARTLEAHGRHGIRYVDADAWPQDFIESCDPWYGWDGVTGIDNESADAHMLSVFAGHGYSGGIGFSHDTGGICNVNLGQQDGALARLGSMGGGRAGYAMYLSCCTLNHESISWGADYQWLRQQFGFHDIAKIGDDQPADFYNATETQSNASAWLSEMEDRPSWFTGDNSPAVLTHDFDSNGCWSEMNNDSFQWGSRFYTPLANAPSCGDENALPANSFWCYLYRNHNNGGC